MSFKDTIHDVVAVGNALVDILAQVPDSFLEAHGMEKGTMSLIDAERALQIQESLGETVQTSGGSAANTLSGIASLGGSALFIGKLFTLRAICMTILQPKPRFVRQQIVHMELIEK